MARQAAIKEFTRGRRVRGEIKRRVWCASAGNPRNEIGEARVFKLVAGGRFELTGHVYAIELAFDDRAVYSLPIAAAADDSETIDLVALTGSPNNYLTTGGG